MRLPRVDRGEASRIAPSSLPHGLQDHTRVLADHLEQDECSARGTAVPALPMAQRSDRDAEPARELPLRQPHPCARRPYLYGVYRPGLDV